MNILVINGPNINMLGLREPNIYGKGSYNELLQLLEDMSTRLDINIDTYQSNYEGNIVTKIQEAYGLYNGIIINPAAYTHTSIAILDALKAVSIPTVEVHISDIDCREDFRKISYTSLAAIKTIKGHGFNGYLMAVEYLLDYLK